ncbi:MAG: hypothetical protein C0393_08015 [Anaerolinea sp.]|nr:hypothetical protein [Anaerolinea sp.]
MTTPNLIVLDTWAILAYFQDEPAAKGMEDLIVEAHEKNIRLMMSVVNVGEVWYILAREESPTEADQSVLELERIGVRFVEADWHRVRLAAGFKAGHAMSFGDCFAAGLAQEYNAVLVTGDPEFKQVEGEIEIRWLK